MNQIYFDESEEKTFLILHAVFTQGAVLCNSIKQHHCGQQTLLFSGFGSLSANLATKQKSNHCFSHPLKKKLIYLLYIYINCFC